MLKAQWRRRAETPYSPTDQFTTRVVCAYLYLDPLVCDAVWNAYLADPQRAWGISPTLDLTALLRHARIARRTLVLRDTALLAVLLSAPSTLVVEAALRYGRPGVLLACAGLVAAWLALRKAGWVAVKLGQRVRAGFTRNRRWMFRIAFLAALTAFLIGYQVAESDVVVFPLAVLLGSVVPAWAISLADQYQSIRCANRCWRGVEPPTATAPVLAAAIEERLCQVPTKNVVFYHEERAPLPFVGSGHRIAHWNITVDMGKGASDDDNDEGPLTPAPFTVGDLYTFLDEDWSLDNAVGIRHGFRLYLNGGKVDSDPALRPNLSGSPRDRLAPETIAHRVDTKDNEDSQRVFFLESVTRQDDLVVTASTRAAHRGRLLFFEVSLNALLPPHPAIVQSVRLLPVHRRDVVREALGGGTRRLPQLVLDSPIRLTRRLLAATVLWRIRRGAVRATRRFRYYDYGAFITAREGLSSADFAHLDDNVRRALKRDTVYMASRLATGLRAFLDAHSIDTTDFDLPQSVVKNVQNWNVDKVQADVVGFGNSNTFVVKTSDDPPQSKKA
ncbi:hypothetical protein GCM10027176_70630 [Actinoallomurus bryophytorum]